MQVAKRYFNTSGPNIRAEHYTLERAEVIAKGLEMVHQQRLKMKRLGDIQKIRYPLFLFQNEVVIANEQSE